MTPRERKPVDETTYSGRLAARLRTLREKKKMSVEVLSQITGIPANTIYNWERGVSVPPCDALPKFAEAFEMSIRTVIPEK